MWLAGIADIFFRRLADFAMGGMMGGKNRSFCGFCDVGHDGEKNQSFGGYGAGMADIFFRRLADMAREWKKGHQSREGIDDLRKIF